MSHVWYHVTAVDRLAQAEGAARARLDTWRVRNAALRAERATSEGRAADLAKRRQWLDAALRVTPVGGLNVVRGGAVTAATRADALRRGVGLARSRGGAEVVERAPRAQAVGRAALGIGGGTALAGAGVGGYHFLRGQGEAAKTAAEAERVRAGTDHALAVDQIHGNEHERHPGEGYWLDPGTDPGAFAPAGPPAGPPGFFEQAGAGAHAAGVGLGVALVVAAVVAAVLVFGGKKVRRK